MSIVDLHDFKLQRFTAIVAGLPPEQQLPLLDLFEETLTAAIGTDRQVNALLAHSKRLTALIKDLLMATGQISESGSALLAAIDPLMETPEASAAIEGFATAIKVYQDILVEVRDSALKLQQDNKPTTVPATRKDVHGQPIH